MPPASILFACISALLVFSSALSWMIRPRHAFWSAILCIAGVLIVFMGLLGWAREFHVAGLNQAAVRIDRLSSVFLMLLGFVTSGCAVYSASYTSHLDSKIDARILWSAMFMFVAGMFGVIVTANAVCFLVAWEMMSFMSTLLVALQHTQHRAQKAALIYLTATRIATGLLCAGFLLMYSQTNSWNLDAWRFDVQSSWLAATLILTGLCIKAGVWPFHIWLPYAHPEAPSPVSAMMSGVMVKVAVYAAIRFFILGHLTCSPIIYALFFLGAITTFWGILFAINQQELKRLLAYSTVENIGLLFLGIALSAWAARLGLVEVSQLAFAGVLLHCVAHGVYKSLLFFCAGSVDYSAHSLEFSRLGGLSKTMPLTCAAFIGGAAASCALPPMSGFGSKWAIYQALFQSVIQMHSTFDRAICLLAIGFLACIGALVIACFVKAIGVAFLGKGRSKAGDQATEVPSPMVATQLIFAAATLALGLVAPRLIKLFSLISASDARLASSIVLPNAHLTTLFLTLLTISFAIYAVLLPKSPIRFITWDCGFGASSAKTQVTAASFAHPIAKIFTPILNYSLAVEISGADRRHFPEKITVQSGFVSLLETRVYGPAAAAINSASRLTGRLQAGSIHIYLLYVCVALVLLIALGIKAW